MAVAAIDAIVSHLMGVTELHRLFDELVGARNIRGTPKDGQETNRTVGKNQRDNTDLYDAVGAATKNLRHQVTVRSNTRTRR